MQAEVVVRCLVHCVGRRALLHLRTDRPIFRRFFITGAIGAVVLFTIVLTTLHIFE